VGVGEAALGDVEGLVLAHLEAVDDPPDAHPDLAGVAQPSGATAATRSSSASVAASSSPRVWARSAARAGLRHTTSRSFG
jgi:hypothetical protein